MVFRDAAMVILVLAMVITFLMTIASKKTMVFGWPENCRFRHRRPLGEHTGKLQKPEKPSDDAETAEMYIYTLSEKYLQHRMAGRPPTFAVSQPAAALRRRHFLPLQAIIALAASIPLHFSCQPANIQRPVIFI